MAEYLVVAAVDHTGEECTAKEATDREHHRARLVVAEAISEISNCDAVVVTWHPPKRASPLDNLPFVEMPEREEFALKCSIFDITHPIQMKNIEAMFRRGQLSSHRYYLWSP